MCLPVDLEVQALMKRVLNYMGQKLHLIGKKFGRLLVINEIGKNQFGTYYWLCKCDCGKITRVRGSGLTSKNIMSCGCLNYEMICGRAKTQNRTHGETSNHKPSKEYVSWQAMKRRCSNPLNQNYRFYGGRGIKVCDRWLKFENFLADMGRRPSIQHTLDRIDINGNYELSNCRWATKKEQANNRHPRNSLGKF